MMLMDKNAVIYGAGGSLGSAVAKALARAGANVFLTGHNIASVQKVANEIKSTGGKAESDQVDALIPDAISSHLEKVVRLAGKIDISFNAVGEDLVQGIPLIDMKEDDFITPITFIMQTRFLTATAAGKIMAKQGSGVILSLTATPGGIGYPYTGGFSAACAAVETFSKNLAANWGKKYIYIYINIWC